MADTGAKTSGANGEDYTGWTNPANANASDDNDAYPAAAGNQHDWYNFAFGVPAGAAIDGIKVDLEGAQYSAGGTTGIAVEMSWDGGATYTASTYEVAYVGATDSVQTIGGAADKWGRSWAVADFSDANFRICLTHTGTKRVQLDLLTVTVYYTEAAGGVPKHMMHYKRLRQ